MSGFPEAPPLFWGHFWWPITLLTVGSATTLHLYHVARRPTSYRLAVSLIGLFVWILPVIPLVLGTDTICADLDIFNSGTTSAPFLALMLCATLFSLVGAYWLAGVGRVEALVTSSIMILVAGVGYLLETPFAFVGIAAYCGGTPRLLYVQSLSAILAFLLPVTLFVIRERRGDR